QVEFAVQEPVLPAQSALDRQRPFARLARSIQGARRRVQPNGRLQVAEAQVRLVEVERTLRQLRLAFERGRGQAPGDREIEGQAARGVVDVVNEERQQSDLTRAALHASAERHVSESGVRQAQGLEVDGEVEIL